MKFGRSSSSSIFVAFIFAAINIRASFASWPTFLVVNGGRDIRMLNVTDMINRTSNTFSPVVSKYTVLYHKLEFNIAMDVDIESRLIFFVNDNDELIMLPIDRPRLAKSMGVKILELTEGLCVDWVSKKVYWSDRETNRIEMITYNSNLRNDRSHFGSVFDQKPFLRKSILYKNLLQATSLCVDPIKGYLFFTNQFDRFSIERTWLDGSHRKILIQTENTYIAYLTIDYFRSKIYWVDLNSIYYADYDGNNKKLLIENADPINSLSIFQDFLYWGNNSGIYYTSKEYGNQILNPQFSLINRIVDQISPNILRIFEPGKQLKPADFSLRNPCLYQNGNCSHLCFYTPVAPHRICACPTGIRLEKDNTTCALGHSKILLIARRQDIRMISLDTPNDFTDLTIPLNSTRHVIAVEYDPIEGFMYWSDTDSDFQALKRAKLDGSAEKTIISSELGHCDGLAVDWIARNLYWTDIDLHRIEVARLDGSARRVVVSSNVKNPRAIVVNPIRGYMYWTDWQYSKPIIERAFLDGSNREIFFEFPADFHLPNGLVLDSEANFLYYTDARSDEIVRFNIRNATDNQVIVNKGLEHVFGLTLLDDYLYWSDWQSRSLARANKNDGSNRTILLEIADLMGLKAVDLSVIPSGTNPCAINNGGCSHFCFYLPTGKICECPGDYELSTDNRNCILPDGYLLYTQSDDHSLRRISLTNSNVNPYRLALNTDKRILMIDYNWNSQKLFWVTSEDDHQYGVIYSSYLNGTKPRKIIDNGISFIENVAVDWAAENIYFSDSYYKSIQMAKITGEFRRIVVWKDITHPLALAVHPLAGHIFWSDVHDSTIKLSDLDGHNIKIILKNQGARVNSLVIDYQTDLLYFTDQESSISVLNYKTLSVKKLINRNKNFSPTLITLYYDQLYWLNFQQKTISACNTSKNCKDHEDLHRNKANLIALTAVYSRKQIGKNACTSHKNDCQHLCMFSAPSSYRCACASHYTLHSGDLKSCRPPKSFILFTQKASIYRVKPKKFNLSNRSAAEKSISNSNKEFASNNQYYLSDDWENDDTSFKSASSSTHRETFPPVNLHRSPNDQILTLNFDPRTRNILWVSSNFSNEKNSYFAHKASENDLLSISDIKFPVNNHIGHPVKIVFDPFSTAFFWISSLKSIQISRISDTKMEHLGSFIHNSTQLLRKFDPKNLAVDGKRGYLYFVHEWSVNNKPKIVDGTFKNENGVLKPLNKNNDDVTQPKSGSFSKEVEEKMVIFRCNLTNSEECTILDPQITGEVNDINVDLMTGTIFWLSYTSQQDIIVNGHHRRNVSGSLNSLELDGKTRQTMKLSKAYKNMAIYYDNIYLIGQRGLDFVPKFFSQHFNQKKLNADGFVPGDKTENYENNIIQPLVATKSDSKSVMFAISEEIFQAVMKSPCPHSSYCHKLCIYSEKKSSNYECACPSNMVLDPKGYTCHEKKECEAGEFACSNNLQCVDIRKKCDRMKDCNDGSDEDELFCGPGDSKFSSKSHFLCHGPFPSYIHRELLCNGKIDCPDGSDEGVAVCGCSPQLRIFCIPQSGGQALSCIRREWRCDGHKNCQGGEDEDNCDHFSGSFSNVHGSFSNHNTTNYFIYPFLVLTLLLVFIGVYFFVRYNHLKNRSAPRNPTNLNINVLNQHPAVAGSTGAQTVTTNIDLELALYPPKSDSTSRFSPMYSMPPNSCADNSSASMFSNRPDLTGQSSTSSDYLVGGGRLRIYPSSQDGSDKASFDERRFFFGSAAAGPSRKPPSLASSYAAAVEKAAESRAQNLTTDWPEGPSRCRLSVRHKSTVKGSRSRSRSATAKKRLAVDIGPPKYGTTEIICPPPSYSASASVVEDDPNALEPCPSLASDENSELLEEYRDDELPYRTPKAPPPSSNTTELNVSIALSHASSSSNSAAAANQTSTMKRKRRRHVTTPASGATGTRASYRYRRVPACLSPKNPPPTPNVTSASGSSDKSTVSGFSGL